MLWPPRWARAAGKAGYYSFVDGWSRRRYGPRYLHCWVSCKLARDPDVGPEAARFFGGAKEVADVFLCLGGYSKACDSAFQPNDFADNERGRSCPVNESCEDRCEPLIEPSGADTSPPGPFFSWRFTRPWSGF
jgi:hypothetical protein